MRQVFTFKAEAMWLLFLTFVPAAIVFFFALVLPWLRRSFGW